jgi:ubiquinone/menaquinone biosynthesis C-methylase UbiE
LRGVITRLVPARTRWLLRKAVRTARYLPADLADTLLGRRDPLTPPRRKVFVGGVEFQAVGEILCKQLVELGGLQPDDAVLDIGCGIGRVAVPLTRYLSEDGAYHGFDIVPEGIDWCNESIASRFPNFHFELADVHNKVYNPKGQYQADEYRFPYEAGTVDFAFSTSVFTHMLPADVWNYIAETARVLKPRGTCLATFFLLNEESLSRIQAGQSALDFRYRQGETMTISNTEPEQAIAYEEQAVRKAMAAHDLEIIEPIHYGSWSGRETDTSYQDIVVATLRPVGTK